MIMRKSKFIQFKISVYDNDNDLHEYFKVDTEEEKNKILKKYYFNDIEAKYCTVDRVETNSTTFFKRNFGCD